LARELLVIIPQQRSESRIADLLSKHVKDHGAFIHHHRSVVWREWREPSGLTDWRTIVIHQRANGEIVQGLVRSIASGGLLHVESLRVSRQSVRQPGVRGRCGHDLIPPPLGCHHVCQLARIRCWSPLPLAYEQQARRGISRQRPVRNLCNSEIGVRQWSKLIGESVHDACDRAAVFLSGAGGTGGHINRNVQAFCLYWGKLQGACDKCSGRLGLSDAESVRNSWARVRSNS